MALKANLRRAVSEASPSGTPVVLALDATNDGPGAAMVDASKSPVVWLPLSKILDNPYQPRKHYDPALIADLAQSVASLKAELPHSLGLQQVPLARVGKRPPYSAGDSAGKFEPAPRSLYSDHGQLRRFLMERDTCVQLMFGHRRLRAFRVLADGPKTIFSSWGDEVKWPERDLAYTQMPIMLGFALDVAMWQHAITENSQRKNINAIEEAKTLQVATTEFGLTLEEAGKPFGYTNRSTVSNKIRLLRLPLDVQQALENEQITERHARELLQLEADPQKLIDLQKKASANNWTVQTLADHVKREAKRLKEQLERQRQLRAAEAILLAGWTPSGCPEPLPSSRMHWQNSWIQPFNLADKTSKALLRTGLCSGHCVCCVVGYTSVIPAGAIQPDPANAPNICLACNGGWEARNAKIQALQENYAAAIQPTAAEQEATAGEASRAATATALNTTARQCWAEGLTKLDLAALPGDLRFWRAVTQISNNELKSDAHQATSITEFCDRLLERMFQSTASWNQEYGKRVADIKAVNELLKLLTAAAGEVQ